MEGPTGSAESLGSTPDHGALGGERPGGVGAGGGLPRVRYAEGFEALRIARSPEDTKAAHIAIREAVGRHIEEIADKYLIAGETQDTALMFVPFLSQHLLMTTVVRAEPYGLFVELGPWRWHLFAVEPSPPLP